MNLLDLLISISIEDRASGRMDDISSGLIAKGNILSNAFSRVMGAVSDSMGSAINRLDIINNFPKVMSNLGISADAATESINILKGDALKGLPTSLESAVASVQRLTSVNGDVTKSTEYFLALNNAIVAGGANAASQASALEQLSQAYAKGAADGQEWRSLQLAMPAQLEQVAKAFGTTTAGLRDSMKSGEISMEDFMQALVRLNKEGLEGFGTLEEQARAATGGIATQLTNVQNAINRALANVVDGFNESNVVNKAITMLTNAINTVGNTVKPVAESIGASLGDLIDGLGEAFGPMAAQLPAYAAQFASALDVVLKAIGKLVSAIAPALPTIARIAPLLLTVHAAASTLSGGLTRLATDTIPLFVKAGTLTTKAGEGMAGSLAAVASKISGPYAIAVMAAVAALGALAAAYVDAQQKQEQFESATRGLTSAVGSLASGTNGAADNIKAIGDAAEQASGSVAGHVVSLSDLIQKQAELSESIGNSFAGVNEDNAALEEATGIIEKLAGKCDGSVVKFEKLSGAVEAYNSVTGANLSIVDEQSGLLNASTEAIRSNADAWEANAKAQAAQEVLKDLYKSMLDAQRELAEAKDQYASAQAKVNSATSAEVGELAQYVSQAKAMKSRIEEAEQVSKSAEKAYSSCAAQIRSNSAAAAEASAKVKELESSEEGLADALGHADGALDEQGDSLEAAVGAMRSYLDGVYEAQKAAFDSQYKQQQRAYSRAERDYSRQLSKEYDALKKALDSNYDAQKESYDKQYSARKKALDAQYDALKKSLSDELDAVKKSNSDTLSELKKSQSKQVEEFKAATKQRIAAIEDEYDARMKLVDAEKDERTKAIEDQIAALKGQTKAESREHKLSQELQKKAELEKEAQYGKTYKARQQAAKELQELLAEMEQERVEEEREIQIDALEQQKSLIQDEYEARKQSLKDELAERKDSITESREAELEAIQEANEREYETLREHLEAQATALSEANEAKLAAMRESHELALEELKAQQSESLDAIREANQLQLDALREAQEDQKTELGYYYSDQLDALRASQQAQLEALKEAHEQQLEELKATTEEEGELGEEAAEDADTNARTAVKNVIEAMNQGQGFVGAAAGEIRKVIDANVSKVPDDMEGAASSGVDGLVKAISDSEDDAGTATGNLAQAIVDAVGGLPDDMYTAGQNTMQGMEDGMGSVDLATYVWNKGIDILNTINAVFDIHSPSRKTYAIFRNVALGMKNGLDDNAGAVVGSAERMANDVLDAADAAYDGMRRFEDLELGASPGFSTRAAQGRMATEGGVLITGNTFYVRNDEDIELIADKLMTLIDRKRGAGSWSPAFTMA